jgi:hypothetical protein
LPTSIKKCGTPSVNGTTACNAPSIAPRRRRRRRSRRWLVRGSWRAVPAAA